MIRRGLNHGKHSQTRSPPACNAPCGSGPLALVSELQLEAYLQAPEALRRARRDVVEPLDSVAFVPTIAQDAEAALELVAARRPDVIVSDIGLPGMDGISLIREIRQQERTGSLQRLPAIAVTAFTREIDRQQAFEAGFDAHCGKPIKPLEVVREIAMLVNS